MKTTELLGAFVAVGLAGAAAGYLLAPKEAAPEAVATEVAAPPPASVAAAPVPTTQAEYNAGLPPDIHPDSRSRIPLIKREDVPADRLP